VNADLDPVDEQGLLVIPGERICTHRDCINPSHIVGD